MGKKNILCVVLECLFAYQDLSGWWVKLGVMRYIAKSNERSIKLKKLRSGGQKIYMGNDTYSIIMGIDFYRLNVRMNNVLVIDVFVSLMRRNLVHVLALT